MKLQVFSVFDSKAEAFIQPWYSQTIGTAIRSFEQAVNTEKHDFQKFAGDYCLFHLGDFDQHKGIFNQLKAPVNLGLALTFMKAPQLEISPAAISSLRSKYNGDENPASDSNS